MKPITSAYTDEQLAVLASNSMGVVGLVAPKGGGKQFLAEHLADTILDSQYFAYKKVVVAVSKDGTDMARDLQSFLKLTVPGKDSLKRVLVIADFDNFGHNAQNALLKTLEEPPLDTSIIITVSDTKKILDTIRSRVRWHRLHPLSLDEAKSQLKGYNDAEVEKAWHISQGSAGLLVNLLQEGSDHEMVQAINIAKELLKQDTYGRLVQIDKILKQKDFNMSLLLDAMSRLLRSALHNASKKPSSSKVTATLVGQIKQVSTAQDLCDRNVHSKAILTNLFYAL